MTGIATCFMGKDCLLSEGIKGLLKKFNYAPLTGLKEINDLCGVAQTDFKLILICSTQFINDPQDSIKLVRSLVKDAKIVILAENIDHDLIDTSYRAGVDGYILKDLSAEAFIASLNLIIMGEKIFPAIMSSFPQSHWDEHQTRGRGHDTDIGELSNRERDIVKCLAQGHSNKVIAKNLAITESTVKIHLKMILRKLGLINRTQVAIWAVKNGFTGEQGSTRYHHNGSAIAGWELVSGHPGPRIDSARRRV